MRQIVKSVLRLISFIHAGSQLALAIINITICLVMLFKTKVCAKQGNYTKDKNRMLRVLGMRKQND